MLGRHPPLEQLADGQGGCGPPDGPVLGELGGQFTTTLLGVLQRSMEPERPLDWTVRPETGSTPTATRISNTPGCFSRDDPSPQAPIGPKIGHK